MTEAADREPDALVRAVEATLFAANAPMTVKTISDHLSGADVRDAHFNGVGDRGDDGL